MIILLPTHYTSHNVPQPKVISVYGLGSDPESEELLNMLSFPELTKTAKGQLVFSFFFFFSFFKRCTFITSQKVGESLRSASFML